MSSSCRSLAMACIGGYRYAWSSFASASNTAPTMPYLLNVVTSG